jgi:hypothetical protein
VGAELSPLQKEMERVTKMVTILAISIGIFFFMLGILLAGVDLAESFIVVREYPDQSPAVLAPGHSHTPPTLLKSSKRRCII